MKVLDPVVPGVVRVQQAFLLSVCLAQQLLIYLKLLSIVKMSWFMAFVPAWAVLFLLAFAFAVVCMCASIYSICYSMLTKMKK